MASWTKDSNNGYYTLKVEVTQESQSSANNTSTVKYTITLIANSGYFTKVRVGYKLVMGGTTIVDVAYSNAEQISMSKNTSKVLKTGTTTITHNTDGTKSFAVGTIVATASSAGIVPGSGQSSWSVSNTSAFTLTTIPRQSTITTSASSNVMGNARTITIARNSSSYTHTLTYTFGSASGTIATKTTSTSVSWTVPTSLAAQVATGSIRDSGTIYCKTYSGDTQIGTTTSTTFVAQIPASTVTLGASSVAMGKSQTFTITRASTNLNHKITYTFVNASGTAVSSCTTSGSWTVPASFVAQLSNAKSGTCTCVIETYNGTTSTAAAKVGSVTKTFTATIPAAVVTAPTSALTMGGMAGTVSVSGIHSNLRYTVTYVFGSASGSIGSAKTATTSFSFTPPTSLAAQVASGNSSKAGMITCETFNGTASCGTTTATFTAKIPASGISSNVTTVMMGNVAKLSISRVSSSLTHKLTYNFNSGTTGTIVSSTSATSYDWTVPTSLAANVAAGSISASCDITCTTYNGTASCGSTTVTIPTVKIPISTFSLSANNVTFGSTTGVTINISKAANNLTHTIRYSKDNSNWTALVTRTQDSSFTWKPDASLAADVVGASATWYLKVETYNYKDSSHTGSVGEKSSSITMKVSNSGDTAAPTITMAAESSTTSDVAAGLYIQGYSKVNATLAITPHNAKIVSYTYKVGTVTRKSATGQSLSSYSATDSYGPISGTGNIQLTFTCTDSHGFSSSATAITINSQAYSLPTLKPRGSNSSVIVRRSYEDGTLANDGTYLHIEVGRKLSQIVNGTTQKNYAMVQYKLGSGSWTDIGSVTTDASLDMPVQNINANLAVDHTYTVLLRVYDSFTGGSGSGTVTQQTYTIPTDYVAVDIDHLTSGSVTDDGIGIGMYAQAPRQLNVAWTSYFERIRSRLLSSYNASATSQTRSHLLVTPRYSASDITGGTNYAYPYEEYFKAWLKQVCIDYSGTLSGTNLLVIGTAAPGTRFMVQGNIYDPAQTDTTTGLPLYSSLIAYPTTQSLGYIRFGTYNGAWICHPIREDSSAYNGSSTSGAPLEYVSNSIISSASNLGMTIRRCGRFVTLDINATPTSTNAGSSSVTVAKINLENWVPYAQVQQVVPLLSNTYNYVAIYVTTGGEIKMLKNNTATQGIRCNLSWITTYMY